MATDDLEALRKTLRRRLESETNVALPAGELRLLLDAVGRLQQSNDRLRRQNRRLRLRLQRAGLEGPEDGDAEVAQ